MADSASGKAATCCPGDPAEVSSPLVVLAVVSQHSNKGGREMGRETDLKT